MPSLNELRTHARTIFSAALIASDPGAAVKRNLRLRGDQLYVAGRAYELASIRNIFVAGCGKASAPMASAVEELLGDKIGDGVIVAKYGHGVPPNKIRVVEAGHPIPDQAGLDGARQVVELVYKCDERDLVLFLISGGGSALLPFPAGGLSLADKQQTTEALLKSGAGIGEINTLRKHLSRLKGGQLVKLAAPARMIALILSDVIGDALDAIASGPTAPDNSTYDECLEILRRYQLHERIPSAVIDYLQSGADGKYDETPKPSDAIFQAVQNVVMGSNRMAVEAARRRADELGYHTMMLADAVEGESRAVARSHASLMQEIARTNKPIPRPACVISGGETTVTIYGDGVGGRNQEFALAAAIEIDGLNNAGVLSGGIDGTDEPPDAARVTVDESTVERGKAMGLDARDFLNRNDSYDFLRATDDLLVTGPTLTNVMDIQVALIS